MAADDGTSAARRRPAGHVSFITVLGRAGDGGLPDQPCERSVPLIENCGLDTLELLYFAAVLRFNVANDILSGRLVNDYI
jgi:hypothetical protein